MIKESDEKLNKKLNKESIKKSKEKLTKKMFEVLNKYDDSDKELHKMFKESDKESYKELIETISPKNDENTTNWYEKNTFNEILTTVDSNNFNHKNKIGKLKFNDINNLINNIKNNTISEANAKKKINELNETKKVETKGKRLIDSQKTLISLFDDLVKVILNNSDNNNNNNNNNNSNNSNNIESDSENESVNENENEIQNESDDEQYYQIEHK